MFDKNNPYTLRTESAEGVIRYYVSFTDGQDRFHEVEVNKAIYLALDECRKSEKRQKNFFDRHIEQSEVTEEPCTTAP